MKILLIPQRCIKKLCHLPALFNEISYLLIFQGTLILYIFQKLLIWISGVKPISFITKLIFHLPLVFTIKLMSLIDPPHKGGVTATDLIELAIQELRVKKVRTIITIGGMSIGFGSIIFLLSLGYGLQKLVVSRVANLNEMRQAQVIVTQSSRLAITDESVEMIRNFPEVEAVFPQIGTVAKISFSNAVADAVAYAVTSRYLQESAVQPIQGKIFENEDYLGATTDKSSVSDASTSATTGEVAGVSEEYLGNIQIGQSAGLIRYSLHPLVWQPVFEQPDDKSQVLGYTKRQTGQQEATEIWGQTYSDTQNSLFGRNNLDQPMQTWIKDSFALWKKTECTPTDLECLDGHTMVKTNSAQQLVVSGYITQESTNIERFELTIQPKTTFQEGTVVGVAEFQIGQTNPVELYSQPKLEARMTNSVTKSDFNQAVISGELVLGDYYFDSKDLGYALTSRAGKRLGYWIKAKLPVWRNVECGPECDNYFLPYLDDNGTQQITESFIRATDISLLSPLPVLTRGQVLGEATDSAQLSNYSSTQSGMLGSTQNNSASTDFTLEDDLDWAMIASQAGIVQPKEIAILKRDFSGKNVALINMAFLNLLGITKEEGVNKEFEAKFVFDGKLFGDSDYRAESEQLKYKIIGILPDEKTPIMYLPFSDLQNYSINNYSQMGVMVHDKNQLQQVRDNIESMGFKTSSVVDTVEGINSLFGTVRLVLLVLGMVALGVAALGMFNTLTVSLLEKTRQVGLMKAMGMKSQEIKKLFLAESIIMGVSGGLLGITIAFIAGKLVSAILSSMAMAGGVGTVDVSYIPPSLAGGIIICSFLIGFATGWYPSTRATKISALNALRYE